MKIKLEKKDIGAWVKYIGGGGGELGRLKSFNNESETAFVVFNCAGQWLRYFDYTGQSVKYKDLDFSRCKND